MTALGNLRRDYRAAFLRYLPRQDEAALHAGYQIGRAAVTNGLSILDLAEIHHEMFLEVLHDTTRDDLTRVGTAASEFFVEVLATYDMTQRGLRRPDLAAGGHQ